MPYCELCGRVLWLGPDCAYLGLRFVPVLQSCAFDLTFPVVRFLSHCGVGGWALILWPCTFFLAFLRQLLFLHMVEIVLVAAAPDDSILWRQPDYTNFVFMLRRPYLALVNSAAECWNLALTFACYCSLDSEANSVTTTTPALNLLFSLVDCWLSCLTNLLQSFLSCSYQISLSVSMPCRKRKGSAK